MENTFIFASEKEVRFTKLLKFIVTTYLTSLLNTVYTIIDGIFVSTYVGTNALASINIVYPIVNVLTGIALVFATGGSAVTALHIGGNGKKEAECPFSVSSFAAILLGCLYHDMTGFIPNVRYFKLKWELYFSGYREITFTIWSCKIFSGYDCCVRYTFSILAILDNSINRLFPSLC